MKTFRPIWRFRYKADGRAKARLCFPGHKQLYGVNFTDTQSPTLQMTSFRLFLSIAHLRNAQIRHLDVKNAYLHALVNEEVYMEQPTGFIDPDRPDHVCKMNRALYGMKQAGRLWNQLAHQILLAESVKQSEYDPCVYYDDLKAKNGSLY